MEKIDVNKLNPVDSPQNRESISDPLDAKHFSMNYYTLDSGEAFAGSPHTHLDQEESFFILEGEAIFEIKTEPTEDSQTVTVSEGQIIRFEPGEYQQGRNESDEPLRALALGTPRESTDIRASVPCQECDESNYMEFVIQNDEPALVCPVCSAEVSI